MILLLYGILSCACVIIDRVTKLWALHACVHEQVITPWLSCSLAFNRGVAWSLFHSESAAIFMVVTGLVVMVIGCVGWHAYERYNNSETIWGEVLVLAGACSNVIDRFVYGAVIDFIGIGYGSFCWPLFNFADIFVVIGIGIMILTMIRDELPKKGLKL